MKVLFLDIDGVLNGHEFDDEAQSCNINRACVKRLSRVVRETGCKIVLSSAWRYMIHGGQMTMLGFSYMMRTHGLSAFGNGSMGGSLFIGLTRKDDDRYDPTMLDEDERAKQCRDWLDWWNGGGRSVLPGAIVAFAAIDDEDHKFSLHGIPAVITDGKTGMTDDDASKLIALLGAD